MKTLNEADRLRILSQPLPKYLWRLSLEWGSERYAFMYDATDISQGKLFVCAVPYSSIIDHVLRDYLSKRDIESIPHAHARTMAKTLLKRAASLS